MCLEHGMLCTWENISCNDDRGNCGSFKSPTPCNLELNEYNDFYTEFKLLHYWISDSKWMNRLGHWLWRIEESNDQSTERRQNAWFPKVDGYSHHRRLSRRRRSISRSKQSKRRAIPKVRHDNLPSARVWHDDPPSLEQRRAITKVRHDDLPSARVWHDDPPSLEQRRVITKVRLNNLSSAKVWHDDPSSLEQRKAMTKIRQDNPSSLQQTELQ